MKNRALRVTQVGIMAALTAAGAFIRIPLPFVPVTLQLTGVCLAGVWLGARRGALSQAIYLALGLMGFPVFARGGGPQYILQPTFGYLLGFPLAAAAVGAAARGPYSLSRATLAGCAGLLVVYATGITGLYLHLRWVLGRQEPWVTVAHMGLTPLPKDLLLTVPLVAAALRARQARRLRRCCDT